jgi:hypothetical protein
LEKKIEISQTLLEDKRHSSVQGEDNFQDVKLDVWKINYNIISITKELA